MEQVIVYLVLCNEYDTKTSIPTLHDVKTSRSLTAKECPMTQQGVLFRDKTVCGKMKMSAKCTRISVKHIGMSQPGRFGSQNEYKNHLIYR